MTFKLTIGDRLARDPRAPASQNASDLVRTFRQRFRDEANMAKAQLADRKPAGIALFDRARSPRKPGI